MFKVKFGKSIRAQLLISFFFIVFLMILTSIASIYYVRKVYDVGNKIYTTNVQTVDYLNLLNINIRRIDKFIGYLLNEKSGMTLEKCNEALEEIQQENTRLIFKYENLDYGEEERKTYDKCKLSFVYFTKDVQNVINLYTEGKVEEARKLYYNDMTKDEDITLELLEKVADIATENAIIYDRNNYDSYRKVVLAIVATMVLTTVLAVMIAFRVSNSFTDKLNVIQRWAKRISEYNVSEDIDELKGDEFGITTKALNDSQFMIRDLVEKIMEESAVISDTGKEVSSSIRKTKKRMEDMNLFVLKLSDDEKATAEHLMNLMIENSVSMELLSNMKELLNTIDSITKNREDFCKELSSMAVYMEQIAITSDYQNKLAETHREQVGKLKVKKDV